MELSSSSGPVSMPVIGFGTAADNNDGATLISAVLESIELGYRQGRTQAEGKGGPGPPWVQNFFFLVYKTFIKKA